MIAEVHTAEGALRYDLSRPFDLSAPIYFDGRSARAFSLPAAEREPVRAGAQPLNVGGGGSVNCDGLVLYPHGNGTHTECVGHVVSDEVFVRDVAPAGLLPASVITVLPTRRSDANEAYGGDTDGEDEIITAAAITAAWPAPAGERAVVIRTGAERDVFSGTNPPYFTDDAAELLRTRGVDHVLVDLPSLDREHDGGALSAHRAFFGLAPGQRSLGETQLPPRTITEMCRIPDACHDGRYLLSLGVAPFASDAAPARPVLFALETP